MTQYWKSPCSKINYFCYSRKMQTDNIQPASSRLIRRKKISKYIQPPTRQVHAAVLAEQKPPELADVQYSFVILG